jgi:hypothetical protein
MVLNPLHVSSLLFSCHSVCQLSISSFTAASVHPRGSLLVRHFSFLLEFRLSVFRQCASCSGISLHYPCFCLWSKHLYPFDMHAFTRLLFNWHFPVTTQFISHVLFSLWSFDFVLRSLHSTCFLAHDNYLLTLAIAIAFHIVHSLERIFGAFFATPSQLYPFMRGARSSSVASRFS